MASEEDDPPSNMPHVALVNEEEHDPVWKYCEKIKRGHKIDLQCLQCGKIYKSGKIIRVKEHLAGREEADGKRKTKSPEEIPGEADDLENQPNLNSSSTALVLQSEEDTEDSKGGNYELGLAIGRFFLDTGLGFNAVVSP
ncbi:hypothetical protein E3N88_34088 [Mikania micrantha]|uniref:BED-type domain-containing protein n=1 Tax=Mikania micrantha TaxID=192012 RepID=A0A5N6MDI8_9ASTR|nr:hypothetical protein E3N88_34088 [Mikania micrantha]